MDEEIKMSIDATGGASARVRYVLYLLLVECLLLFYVEFTFRPQGFLHTHASVIDRRIQLLQKDIVSLEDKERELREAGAERALSETRLCLRDAYRRCDAMEEERRLLRSRFHEYLTVREPFLGMCIHVNELGVVAGAAIFVTMVMLALSLHRFRVNLSCTLRLAESNHGLMQVYRQLAMREVLTVPAQSTLSARSWLHRLEWALRFLLPHWLVYCVPLFLLVVKFRADVASIFRLLEDRLYVVVEPAIPSATMSLILLLLVLLVTYAVVRLKYSIAIVWATPPRPLPRAPRSAG